MLICDDSLHYLSTMQDSSVDLILTDPAYETMESHLAMGTTTRLKNTNGWFDTITIDKFASYCDEFCRVLRPDRDCYVMVDPKNVVAYGDVFFSKFTFRNILVWDKKSIGMGYSYRRRSEFILFGTTGKRKKTGGAGRKLNNMGIPDIIQVPRVSKAIYPTQKPVELMKMLIEQSTCPGEMVLDPFNGSGSVALAARNSGREYIGIDIREEAIALTKERLAA